jgi:hypothetical protein
MREREQDPSPDLSVDLSRNSGRGEESELHPLRHEVGQISRHLRLELRCALVEECTHAFRAVASVQRALNTKLTWSA